MKTIRNCSLWLGGVCAVLLGAVTVAWAQEEDLEIFESAPPAEPQPEVPALEPVGPSVPEVESELPPTELPPEELPPTVTPPPAKPKPTARGAELTEPFKSSLFGPDGRRLKLPAKTSARRAQDSWQRELQIGVTTAQGNKDNLRYNAALSASKKTKGNTVSFKLSARYGESNDERDTQNATAEAKGQHFLDERWYMGAEANVYHDQIADLAYRARASLALGRYLIRSDRLSLGVEAGPGYVAEKKGEDREGFLAGRAAQHLEVLVADNVLLWQAVEYIPSFEEPNVYFINAEAGVETLLMANLSLIFSVENRFDSNPAEGKERNDLLTTTALSWKF